MSLTIKVPAPVPSLLQSPSPVNALVALKITRPLSTAGVEVSMAPKSIVG